MFKVLLFLFVSTLIPTNNPYGSSMDESDDELMKWPYVKRTFVASEVQSPINILSNNSYDASLPSLLYFRYWRDDSVKIQIKNSGHALHIHSITDDDENKISAHITGGPLFDNIYNFSHFHIYWGAKGEEGSEHQINSQGYPIEVQMIHYKNEYGHYSNALGYSDGICIISYFGKLSDQDNPKMENFIKAVESVKSPKEIIFISTFNVHFHWLMEVAKDYCYYAYPGSITVYPYSPCVTWIIYENTFNISQGQLEVFRSLRRTNGNLLTSISRRILQPFNNRPLCYI